MAKFTIGQRQSAYTPPKYLTPEDVDTISIADNGGQVFEIRENIKNLIAKNNILPQSLDNMLSLKNLCDYEKYREFLKRRNTFLENHQLMDADQFAKLFGNEDLKDKEIDNNIELISGKYNKADINQGKLGICVFDTFLKQLKETPFFETLVRCSLQRNETNDGRKCLIPFCNNEGLYEEISDEDINYLKTSKIGDKELISDTSLGFNIIETILVKMVGNKEKYPILASGWGKFRDGSGHYEDLKAMSPEDLKDITYGINTKMMRDSFLGKDTIKSIGITDYNDEEIEWLINLTKTGIIKLTTGVIEDKINKYKKSNITNFGNELPVNNDVDEDSNEKILSERGYPLKILHEAGPNEEISIGKAKGLGTTFKIKGTKERFVPGHAYSIEGMHKKNGETFVTIINPRYTGKKIDVPLKYIKEFFYIGIYGFNLDNMFVENSKDQKK